MQLSESEAQGGSPQVSEGRLRVDMCFMIVPSGIWWILSTFALRNQKRQEYGLEERMERVGGYGMAEEVCGVR